jgi:phosphopantetheinyl transferase
MAGTITVWRARSRIAAAEVESLQDYLSKEETAQSERFRRREDRACFVTGHALLRILLAAQLDAAPSQIKFETGSHGKPRLSARFAAKPLAFNLAHSHGSVLVALCDTEIGVDLESPRGIPDMLEVADRFFSPGEAHALRFIPDAARPSVFYRVWTMKEAVLKLTGSGIAGGLDTFSVPTVGIDLPFCASVRWNEAGLDRYSAWKDTRLLSFYAWPHVPAALAWCSPAQCVRFREGDPLLTSALFSELPTA